MKEASFLLFAVQMPWIEQLTCETAIEEEEQKVYVGISNKTKSWFKTTTWGFQKRNSTISTEANAIWHFTSPIKVQKYA